MRARGCARRVVPRSHGPGGVPRYELVPLPSTASLQRRSRTTLGVRLQLLDDQPHRLRTRYDSTLKVSKENWRGWGGAAEVDREEASGREGAGCRAATSAATPPCYCGGHVRVQRLSGEWQTEQQQANPIPIPNLNPNLNPNGHLRRHRLTTEGQSQLGKVEPLRGRGPGGVASVRSRQGTG